MPHRFGIRWGDYLTYYIAAEMRRKSLSRYWHSRRWGSLPRSGTITNQSKRRIMKNIEEIMTLDFGLDFTDYLYGESLTA